MVLKVNTKSTILGAVNFSSMTPLLHAMAWIPYQALNKCSSLISVGLFDSHTRVYWTSRDTIDSTSSLRNSAQDTGGRSGSKLSEHSFPRSKLSLTSFSHFSLRYTHWRETSNNEQALLKLAFLSFWRHPIRPLSSSRSIVCFFGQPFLALYKFELH